MRGPKYLSLLGKHNCGLNELKGTEFYRPLYLLCKFLRYMYLIMNDPDPLGVWPLFDSKGKPMVGVDKSAFPLGKEGIVATTKRAQKAAHIARRLMFPDVSDVKIRVSRARLVLSFRSLFSLSCLVTSSWLVSALIRAKLLTTPNL